MTLKSMIKTCLLFMSGLVLLTIYGSEDLMAIEDELPVVESVNLEKYLGKWHEIARIDHGFQRGCKNSIADYSLRGDGDIDVTNSCEMAGRKDRKEAMGRAWVTDKTTNSKLRVQFFLPWIKLEFLSGRYWILELGEDYDYVMVGEPSRDYLWILARTPDIDKTLEKALFDKAETLGFDTKRLLLNSSIE